MASTGLFKSMGARASDSPPRVWRKDRRPSGWRVQLHPIAQLRERSPRRRPRGRTSFKGWRSANRHLLYSRASVLWAFLVPSSRPATWGWFLIQHSANLGWWHQRKERSALQKVLIEAIRGDPSRKNKHGLRVALRVICGIVVPGLRLFVIISDQCAQHKSKFLN